MAAVALTVAACDEEGPDREASPVESKTTQNIHFADYDSRTGVNGTTATLSIDSTYFVVALERQKADTEATVELQCYNAERAFDVPDTVTFAKNKTTVNIRVELNKDVVKPFAQYTLYINLLLTPDQAYSYADDATVAQHIVTVTQEDFKRYGMGIFSSDMWGSWVQLIEYSPMLDAYRLPDLIEKGYHRIFKLDEGGATFKVVSGVVDGAAVVSAKDTETSTGSDHPTYGMIMSTFYAHDGSHGSLSDKVYTFYEVEYTVQDVSFGAYKETFQLVNTY